MKAAPRFGKTSAALLCIRSAWLLAICLTVFGSLIPIAHGAETEVRIASLEKLLRLLDQARTVDVQGAPPFDNTGSYPLITYPIQLSGRREIQPIADLFHHTPLKQDDKKTGMFRDGATIGTSERSHIVIDGKFTFGIVSGDLVILADYLTYTAEETPGPLWSDFHRDFVRTLSKIQKNRAQ
jgi:hypothetical protein